MKQILQNLGSGETILAEVPCPKRGRGKVLCQTTRTLVSLGTEKMLIDFGKSGWIAKARSQPDKVKQVLQKIKTDGLKSTIETVRAKLDTPIPLGYCHVGKIVEADATSCFSIGDRVISNGGHAEMVAVPENLVAKIPEGVTDDAAAFTVVGAIGLQGIRLLNPTLGERIVVSGLGLIGLLTVQMLKAQGCHVLGVDFDPQKLELARSFGASVVDLSAGQDPVSIADHWTKGQGVDGVIITASTKSNELIHQAATMCRKRGRIVLVGVIGLNLQRADFYEKELSFQVSCSYGPGRYESNYEQKGMDYPIGFVRWTEQRNFEAVLSLISEGKLQTAPLITHRFKFDEALSGYQAINQAGAMGILLEYPDHSPEWSSTLRNQDVIIPNTQISKSSGDLGLAFIGAGGFSTRMLMPLIPSEGIVKKAVVSSGGVSSTHAANKFGFAESSTDAKKIIDDPSVDVVFITTPHNTHCKLVCESIEAGKHVFVEKPLAMNDEELEQIRSCVASNPGPCLMIGFNRRFSPHTESLKKWLATHPGPKSIIITVNAGEIPADHWTQDAEIGGGRIIGEACHFIDLARFLADSAITAVHTNTMTGGEGRLGDCVSIQIGFSDGSIATVHYLANGSKDFPKERIEIFAGGRVLVCNNFRNSNEIGGKRSLKTRGQDKGHANEIKTFISALKNGGDWPIPAEQLFEVSAATIKAANQVQETLKSQNI